MTSLNSNSGLTLEGMPTVAAINATPDDQKFQGLYKERSSKYRGVSKIKDREMYEAHASGHGHASKRGRTVYLGRVEKEEEAARAHDLFCLKYWGPFTPTNFPISNYEKEMGIIVHMTERECVTNIRRYSACFSRGSSKYRGVARHTKGGRWQSRKGQGKEGFLGSFNTEEEAAMAFDIASIQQKGRDAMTNFNINHYDVEAILVGKPVIINEETAKQLKDAEQTGSLKTGGGTKTGGLSKQVEMNSQQCPGKQKEIDFSSQAVEVKAPQTLKQKQDEAPRFQHWAFHDSFKPYERMVWVEPSSELMGMSMSSFRHSNSGPFRQFKPAKTGGKSSKAQQQQVSGPFQLYKQGETGGECSNPQQQQVNHPLASFQYKVFGSFEPFRIKPRRDEFRHASSSTFKPYSKN